MDHMHFLCEPSIIFTLLVFYSSFDVIGGLAWFTQVPPNVLYVSNGNTARFVWDYKVDDRTRDFETASPNWYFYNESGSVVLIGYESVFEERKWKINRSTCPRRLLNPTRVSKESNATLVIKNVTKSDSGVYGCSLMLLIGSPITSKVQLVVTSSPYFTTKSIFSTKSVMEYQKLVINCSAIGTPKPNITWVGSQGVIKSQGVGNAILKIHNITRHESGIYRCEATNNPNETPVRMETKVLVLYKPYIVSVNSSCTVDSLKRDMTRVRCLADGEPLPLITWYDTQGKKITKGIRNITGGSILIIITGNNVQYGLYRCKAENMVGHDEHLINVTRSTVPVPMSTYLTKITDRTITSPKSDFQVNPTSLPICNCERDCQAKDSPPILFFQGNISIIILLSISCVSILVNIILITCKCLRIKRNHLKVADIRKDTVRFVRPEGVATANEEEIVLTTIEPKSSQEILTERAVITPREDDYERMSDESVSSSVVESTAARMKISEAHPLQREHVYQELNEATLITNKKVYQSLDKTGDVVAQVQPTAVAQGKYEPLKFADKPQSSEYQKLHLYANIEVGKK